MFKTSLRAAAVGSVSLLLLATLAQADPMADAKTFLQKYAGKVDTWDGPTSGPKGVTGKTIIVLAGDMKNGGILGVTTGVQEAAKVVGWTVRVIDGAGTVSGRTAAFSQALALKPDGLIVNGFDAIEQKPGLDEAQAAKIPIVSWHSGPVIGPLKDSAVRVNVSTDPMEVSKAAALWAYVDAGGKPGVVIFTDGQYAIALAKANRMKEVIEQMGGKVLSFEDTPIADTSNRMPQLTTSLLQRFGAKWTHSLAINDIYYDFMGPSLSSAGIPGDGSPKPVAAGDGSESAYQRIRAGEYQSVTVAEPLNLQGWQLVDELNRAFMGQPASNYVSPLHVVTKENVEFDGGPHNGFDPDNGYRKAYTAIWTGK